MSSIEFLRSTGEVPRFAYKTANLRCGKKTIVIELQKPQNKSETVQLNEELSAHQIQNQIPVQRKNCGGSSGTRTR